MNKRRRQTIKGGKANRFYLDPVGKLAKTENAWSSILVPPFDDDVDLKKVIQTIYDKLQNKGVLTHCKFDDRIQNRIKKIMDVTKSNGERVLLSQYVMEMQLYLLVCRNQMTNRAFLTDFVGNVV